MCFVLSYLKNVYSKSAKKVQPVEIKFMKNLAKLNELEPATEEDEDNGPSDAISTPDIVINVQVSQSLTNKTTSSARVSYDLFDAHIFKMESKMMTIWSSI